MSGLLMRPDEQLVATHTDSLREEMNLGDLKQYG